MTFLYILLALFLLAFLFLWILWRLVFCVKRPRKLQRSSLPRVPRGKEYLPYKELMLGWARKMQELGGEELSIESFDGLHLCGRYFEYSPDSTLEIMFHGYRGDAERDLAGGIERCFAHGRSALIVDQRCSGLSEGSVISFGVNEQRDCLKWIDKAIERFGPERRIILTGISMGASTVLMAAGHQLPPNVVGVLADCGYSSAPDVVRHVLRSIHLPVGIFYPCIRFAGKLFGGLDLEDSKPVEAVKSCRVPVILFHGEADSFVPCRMSREIYEACPTRKMLVTVPGAAHGISYPAAPELYLSSLHQFFPDDCSV